MGTLKKLLLLRLLHLRKCRSSECDVRVDTDSAWDTAPGTAGISPLLFPVAFAGNRSDLYIGGPKAEETT